MQFLCQLVETGFWNRETLWAGTCEIVGAADIWVEFSRFWFCHKFTFVNFQSRVSTHSMPYISGGELVNLEELMKDFDHTLGHAYPVGSQVKCTLTTITATISRRVHKTEGETHLHKASGPQGALW